MRKLFLGLLIAFTFTGAAKAADYKWQIKTSRDVAGPGYTFLGQGDFKIGPSTYTYVNRISSWTAQFGTDINLEAGQKFYLDAASGVGDDTYIYESPTDIITFYAGGQAPMQLTVSAVSIYKDLIPKTAGTINSGSATEYWADISYKTLTDRGCLGWFDDGVELQDGTIVSDIEAIMAMEKHPTKLTIYGTPMLNYKTFPKVSYKPADEKTFDAEGNEIGTVLIPRDINNEPVRGADGIEMTSVFSIMLGAFKEINTRVEDLESRVLELEGN